MNRSLRVMLVAAVAAVSLPVAAQAAPKPGKPGGGGGGGAPNLRLTAVPNPIVFGSTTKLSGRLTGPNNGGMTVTLRRDEFPYNNTDVKDVATTKTDAKGNYTFTQRPVRNTSYQAVVGTTASTGVIVNVRIRVGLRVSDATPRVGQLVTFRGRACPRHDGLVIAIKRRTATGGFVTVRRARLKAGDTCSVYARSFRIFRDGAYRVVADDADHAKGVSPTRFIDVHR